VDLGRKGDGERAPYFAALLPCVACTDIETRVGKDGGDCQVRPQGRRAEVERVEVVPPEKAARAAECRARIRARPDRLPVGRFDPYWPAVEDAAEAAARVRREDNALVLGRNSSFEVEKPAALELGSEREAIGADLDLELGGCVPALASTVRRNRLGQE
jgi:hypothetical protein